MANKISLSRTQIYGFNAATERVRVATIEQRAFLADVLREAGENPEERWVYNEQDFSLVRIPNLEEAKKDNDVNQDPE